MFPKANLKTSARSLSLTLIAIAIGWTASGCSMLGWKRDREVVRVIEDASHPVSEILCLWEPAEGHDMKGLPCRGFAGQLLFFSVGNEAPAEVGGEVMIYVFDDHGTVEEQQRPIHQFNFPNESWKTYLRDTNFGASYQLFIPYTRHTSEAATCNLRVRYTSPEGRITFSKIVEIQLPGTPRLHAPPTAEDVAGELTPASLLEQLTTTRAEAGASSSPITQASHTEPALLDPRVSRQGVNVSSLDVSTSSIEVPPTQLVNHQMAALNHLVSSLEPGTGTPAAPANTPSPATTTSGVSQDHLLAPAERTEAAATTPAPRSHRLHPLAGTSEAAP